MKRLLSSVLVLVMLFSVTLVASAEETNETSNELYKDIVFEAFGDMIKSDYPKYRYIHSYNADGSTVDEGETPDYIVGWLNAGGTAWAVVERVIGDYYFTYGCICQPYDLGYFICSTKENKCYSLDDAWEYKLPNVEIAFAKAGKHIDEIDNEYTLYRSRILSILGWEDTEETIRYNCLGEYNADGTETAGSATPDYAVIFAHKGAWTEDIEPHVIGNYCWHGSTGYDPGYIVYSLAEDKIYTLREAYNDDLPGVEFALGKVGTKVTWYAPEFEDYLKKTPAYKELASSWDFDAYPWYSYKEVYYYTDGKGTDKMPETTPDYVLIDGTLNMSSPSFSYGVIGDYVLFCENCGNPDCLGYFVYTPEDGKMRTLKEAYDAGVEGIGNVFTDYGLGLLMGDADGDGRLTIKDATYIQKYLAKVEGINPPADFMGHDACRNGPDGISVADFDINGKVNIKDATAIQKRLAKIDI